MNPKYKCDKKLRIYSGRPQSQYSSKHSEINSSKKSKKQPSSTKTQKSKNYNNNINYNNCQLNQNNLKEDYFMNYNKDYRNLDKMIKDYMGDYEKMVQKNKIVKIPEYQETFNYQEYEDKQKKFRIMFDNFTKNNSKMGITLIT